MRKDAVPVEYGPPDQTEAFGELFKRRCVLDLRADRHDELVRGEIALALKMGVEMGVEMPTTGRQRNLEKTR